MSGERSVKYLKAYDLYLKRLGQAGANEPGIAGVGLGPILLSTVPFFLAIVLATAAFPAFGWTGPSGFWLKLLVLMALLFGLFYSGFRVVHYRSQCRKDI